jgi:hypothetical protein
MHSCAKDGTVKGPIHIRQGGSLSIPALFSLRLQNGGECSTQSSIFLLPKAGVGDASQALTDNHLVQNFY